MQKVLIVAATRFEVAPFLKHFNAYNESENRIVFTTTKFEITVLITGVGMVETTYFLAQENSSNYYLIVNVGVAGSFDKTIATADLFNVTHDCLSELGAEDNDTFIPFSEMGLSGYSAFVNVSQTNIGTILKLKTIKSITVNKVHGNNETIERDGKLFGTGLESMEGAAFMRCCMNHKHYFQIRSVSNYVEPRNKDNWKMKEAIESLNNWTIDLIEKL